jgi:hypothetical protein
MPDWAGSRITSTRQTTPRHACQAVPCPAMPGRCGFHKPTQGHREGCPQQKESK